VNSFVYQHPPETQATVSHPSRSRSGGSVRESALLLLVLRVLADNHDAAFALDNLALFANGFHTRSYFHGGSPFASYRQKIIFSKRIASFQNQLLPRQVMRPRDKSYGESSTVTLSPGRIRMKFIRSFPEIVASIL
jgi:hypothetical protein